MLNNDIPPRYNPKEAEDKWYKFWEENNFFSAKPNPSKEPFTIVIPPPNVTGILHMGHALNNTIQDILCRYQRMKGKEVLWMPGIDHAGIATQNVVEKSIAKEGLKRQDLGRDKFIQRVWQWKEQYGSTIIHQLKKLGSSCDWNRARFTMDEEYSKAVVEVFVSLYEKGLIYQGDYIINWCPRCQTALSDEEATHREVSGSLYYIKYPLKKSTENKTPNDYQLTTNDYIVVATTRPETMLGDTAVAVNPNDERYSKLIGKTLVLPLINREIKIIADELVDVEFGTGAVKVTPAHDPNDYALGKKHDLDFIKVMYPDGRMNQNAGSYKDLDRFKARKSVLEDLKHLDLLEKVEPHKLSAGHCYRCNTIVEPYLSKQWFVKTKPLAAPAIDAVKNREINFHPERWKKVYLNWMENIQDWCISRQIWWGHRLPVYYCKSCQAQANELSVVSCQLSEKIKSIGTKGVIVSRVKPEKCPVCNSADIYQDEDVLDTWFSSWLWPFATFGWPGFGSRFSVLGSRPNTEHRTPSTDLKYFYPTSVLVTAPEIIFFWVARMIMAGYEFMGELPFKDVYIHGTVRDVEGKKMSKSLGNSIDPLDIIKEYGTDALRFSLISTTAQGQDVFLSNERFEQGRNFANKIWNAARFIMLNLDPSSVRVDLCIFSKENNLGIINRWILSRLYSVLKEEEQALAEFKFNEAANILYSFFWHEFCDWYLEIIKLDIKNINNQVVMFKVLEKFLRALHPFMPFISEEIWQLLGARCSVLGARSRTDNREPRTESIMNQLYPHIQHQLIDKKIEEQMSLVFELVAAIRNMRQELSIPFDRKINAIVSVEDEISRELIKSLILEIKHLSVVDVLEIKESFINQSHSITTIVKDTHACLLLDGVVDLEREKIKISERISKAQADKLNKEKMLANANFVEKAPFEVVESERQKLKDLASAITRLKNIRDGLS